MQASESIIVYRNPLEKAIWEGSERGGPALILLIMAFVFVTLFVFLGVYNIGLLFVPRNGLGYRKYKDGLSMLALGLGFISGFIVMYHLL